MASSRSSFTYVSPVVKYLLFFFNFIFWLIGCILIGVGGWGFLEKNRFAFSGPEKHDITIYDIIFDLTIIMIVVGGIIFTLAFAGCVGALRENICLLKFFSYALGILFVLQVVLAVLAFVFSAAVKAKITEMLQLEGIIRYQGNDPDLTNFIDWFQETFECCGVGRDGFKDWNKNMYFHCNSSNPSHWRCSVPFSCCINPTDIQEGLVNTYCGYNTLNISYPEARNKIYIRGCVDAILTVSEDNLFIIGGIVLGLAVPQIIGVVLGCFMIQDLIAIVESYQHQDVYIVSEAY